MREGKIFFGGGHACSISLKVTENANDDNTIDFVPHLQ